MNPLDDIDRQLLLLLQENARQSNTTLASKIGLTEGAIRRRLSKLLDGGLVKISAIADPEMFGLSTHAVIGINADIGQIEELTARLAEFEELQFVYETTGRWDIEVVGFFASTADMRTFLQQKLITLPGVYDTDTYLIMRTVKRSFQWSKLLEPENQEATPKPDASRRRRVADSSPNQVDRTVPDGATTSTTEIASVRPGEKRGRRRRG